MTGDYTALNRGDAPAPPSFCDDVRALLALAMPIFVSMVAFAGMKTIDTALRTNNRGVRPASTSQEAPCRSSHD